MFIKCLWYFVIFFCYFTLLFPCWIPSLMCEKEERDGKLNAESLKILCTIYNQVSLHIPFGFAICISLQNPKSLSHVVFLKFLCYPWKLICGKWERDRKTQSRSSGRSWSPFTLLAIAIIIVVSQLSSHRSVFMCFLHLIFCICCLCVACALFFYCNTTQLNSTYGCQNLISDSLGLGVISRVAGDCCQKCGGIW